jgi:hypothetical protein
MNLKLLKIRDLLKFAGGNVPALRVGCREEEQEQ